MIECINFKSFEKGCLKGFATLKIPKWGVIIHGCTLNMKNGQRWVNFPSKEYEKDGVKNFLPIIRFEDKKNSLEFSSQALKAIDLFCSTSAQSS